jgi:hypothetical protein
VVDFVSQVNFPSKETSIRMRKNDLVMPKNFLKSTNQRFVEPIGILKDEEIVIMGVPIVVNFEFTNLVNSISTYLMLIS